MGVFLKHLLRKGCLGMAKKQPLQTIFVLAATGGSGGVLWTSCLGSSNTFIRSFSNQVAVQVNDANSVVVAPQAQLLPNSFMSNLVKTSLCEETVRGFSPGKLENHLQPKLTLSDQTSNAALFSGSNPNEMSGGEEKKKGKQSGNGLDQSKLNKVVEILINDLSRIFDRIIDLSIYRQDIVLDDRIRGKVIESLARYKLQVNFLRIWGNIKCTFIQFRIHWFESNLEERTIRVRWSIIGMSYIRMLLLYIPKALWKKENLILAASTVAEGISTYHIDDNAKIYRHVVDNKMIDKGRQETVKPVEEIKKKLQRMKEGGTIPAPSM